MAKATTKKAAAKPKKNDPVADFAAAVDAARKAGVQLHATIYYVDADDNAVERSY